MKEEKKLIFFVSHKYNENIHKKYLSIYKSIRDQDSLVWAIDGQKKGLEKKIKRGKIYQFDSECFRVLGYEAWRGGMIPGNCHYPLMSFMKESKKSYDSYWFIEYDVEYTGEWECLFENIRSRNSDFVASHLRFEKQEPKYKWWELDGIDGIKKEKIRSFNPIFMIKKDALECIHYHHKKGCNGHNEVMFPTLMRLNDYSISDFGGHGPLVPNESINENYLENDLDFCGSSMTIGENKVIRKMIEGAMSTMRAGPCYNMFIKVPNKIYHPVKGKSKISVIKENVKNVLYRAENALQNINRQSIPLCYV